MSLTLLGKLYGSPFVGKYNFTLQVRHYCYLSAITSAAIPNGVKDINDPAILYHYNSTWT